MYKEIYLMLTEACPNRCEYCYIKGRDNPATMTFEQIDQIIQTEKPSRILFFGGEPLLCLDLIEKTMEKYYGKLKFQIVTSTVVNFKEFIDLNEKYPMNEIQLSWDGFADKNRVDTCGKSIASNVYQNIWYAIERGLKFDIKCVIGNENVHIMEEIHKQFMEFKKYGVSGEFVVAHRSLYTDNFLDVFKEQYKKTFTLDKMYMDHLNRIIAVIQNDRYFGSCDAGKYKVITPSGWESYCTALSQEDKKFGDELLQKPCKNPKCDDCKCRCMCDGGCRYERYLEFGDEWEYNFLESTCIMMHVYYDTIREWLDSLNEEETERLYEIIQRYKAYQAEYHSEVKY